MEIYISNHVVKRYKKRVKDSGIRQKSHDEIRNILYNSIVKSSVLRTLEGLEELRGPFNFTIPLFDSDGTYIGKYRVGIGIADNSGRGYIVKTLMRQRNHL
jgi:hypothetical protein